MSNLPVYFINLAKRPDRRAHIEGELERVGLPAIRIEAVTPADLSDDDVRHYCDRTKRHYLTPESVGCTKSHIKCWNSLLALPSAEWALILEDDTVLTSALPTFLREFTAAPPNADVVQLQWNKHVRVLPPTLSMACGVELHPFRSTLCGTNAYLISRSGAAKLMGRDDLFKQPIDTALFRPYTRPGSTICSLLAEPALADHIWEPSSPSLGRSDIQVLQTAEAWDGATGGPLGRAAAAVVNALDHVAHLSRGIQKLHTTIATR